MREKSDKIKQHCIILKLEKYKKAGANKSKRLETRIKGYSKQEVWKLMSHT